MLNFIQIVTGTAFTRIVLGLGGTALVALLAITALSTIGLIAPQGLFLVLMAALFACIISFSLVAAFSKR